MLAELSQKRERCKRAITQANSQFGQTEANEDQTKKNRFLSKIKAESLEEAEVSKPAFNFHCTLKGKLDTMFTLPHSQRAE